MDTPRDVVPQLLQVATPAEAVRFRRREGLLPAGVREETFGNVRVPAHFRRSIHTYSTVYSTSGLGLQWSIFCPQHAQFCIGLKIASAEDDFPALTKTLAPFAENCALETMSR